MCESATVDYWKDYATYVVEVDASSQGVQTLYRKRMQQHGTWGEMTKPTNSAKYLMIEQSTLYSNISFPFCPSSPNMATQQEWEAAVSDTHDTSQALIQVDFSAKQAKREDGLEQSTDLNYPRGYVH